MITIKVRAEDVELFIYSYDYDRYIIDYLEEMYDGKSLSDATVEEMEMVCPYAAEKLYQEVLSLEQQEE